MRRNDNAVVCRVIGQNKESVCGGGRRGGIGGHHQVTRLVITAGSAYGVNKDLIKTVDALCSFPAGRDSPCEGPFISGMTLETGLVQRFEDQVLIIICKALSQLRPDA